MKKLIFLFVLLNAVFISNPGRATTYTPTILTDPAVSGGVNSANGVITGGAGNGQVSLRSAVIAANAHAGVDTITLPAGTYTLSLVGNDSTCQTGDLDINGSLTLNGAGAGTTFIQGASDAAFTGSIGDKVIGINQDGTFTNLTVNIAGVTIRYGRNTVPDGDPSFAYTGGGVDVFLTGTGNFVSFTNCIITGNENVNSYGGGVNIDSGNSGLPGDPAVNTVNRGTVVFSGCTIAGNKAKEWGGGVNLFSDSHNVILENCSITNNTTTGLGGVAANGGGINVRHTYNIASSVTMRGCTIANNSSASIGGGVCVAAPNAAPVTIQSSTLSGNSSGTGFTGSSFGGGLWNDTSVTTLTDVIISGNHADGGSAPLGGGIFCNSSTVNITGGSLSGNTSRQGGGAAVGNTGAALTLSKVTLTNNTATVSGGGLFVSVGTLTANYCRLVGNTAPTGKAVAQTSGTASVANNWWGTNSPASLMSGTVGFTPWLQLTHLASPSQIFVPNSTTLTASFLTNSAGTFVPAANLGTLIGLPVTFNNPVKGTLSGAQSTIQASGTATVTFTANAAGAGSVDATVDNQKTTASITIPTGVSSINRTNLSPTNLTSVAWLVTFTNAISGVNGADFSLIYTGLGGLPAITSVTAVGGAPATDWIVTASTGSGTGTLGLNMVGGVGVSAIILNIAFTGQSYTIDLVAPNTSITAQPASLTNSSDASFSFTGSDTGVGVASFQYQIDGGSYTTAASPVNLSGLSSASHTFNVRAVDGAGNIDASPATVTWTVDTIPPTVNCSTDIVVTANGYCPPNVNYTVSISDNLAISLATTNPASGSVFPLGTNIVTLTARDTAGNTNFCTFKVIVLPGDAPQLSIVRSGTNVVVSWTNSFPCYTLQFASELSSNSWNLYPGPFATNNGMIFVTNSAAITNRFFRLSF